MPSSEQQKQLTSAGVERGTVHGFGSKFLLTAVRKRQQIKYRSPGCGRSKIGFEGGKSRQGHQNNFNTPTQRDLYHNCRLIIIARGDFIQLKVANSFDLKCTAFCILSCRAVNKH